MYGGLAILAYGTLIAPRWFRLERYEVELPGLPAELDGLKIVQISDLHAGWCFPRGTVERVARISNSCDPDLVLVTGDFSHFFGMASSKAGVAALGGLKAKSGVYGCMGNHEYWEGEAAVRKAVEAAGIRMLVNENVSIVYGLTLAAIDDLMSGNPDLDETVSHIPPSDAVVLMSHNPNVLPQLRGRGMLVLSGHTHGGQVALPFAGPRGTNRIPGVPNFEYAYEAMGVRAHGGRVETVATHRYPSGWFRNGGTQMYVSRGTGLSQGVPIRLNCPPEITLFTLRSPGR